MLNQFYFFGQIQTCQIGGQPYSDTSHYLDYVGRLTMLHFQQGICTIMY